MRVCQFRHFGKFTSVRGGPTGPPFRKGLRAIFYRGTVDCQTGAPTTIQAPALKNCGFAAPQCGITEPGWCKSADNWELLMDRCVGIRDELS